MNAYWGHGGPYETWVEFLRRWAAEEPVAPGALPPLADDRFPAETWERLAEHLSRALDTRLTTWADRLVAALLAASDEFSAGRALAQARNGLRAVRAVAAHPGLPETTRTRLTDMVDGQIRDLQDQLERSLDLAAAENGSDPRWVEQRRRTFRDNPLTAALPAGPPAPGKAAARGKADPNAVPIPDPDPDPWAVDPAARPRRRVITD